VKRNLVTQIVVNRVTTEEAIQRFYVTRHYIPKEKDIPKEKGPALGG
jgi:hypothetical protein